MFNTKSEGVAFSFKQSNAMRARECKEIRYFHLNNNASVTASFLEPKILIKGEIAFSVTLLLGESNFKTSTYIIILYSLASSSLWKKMTTLLSKGQASPAHSVLENHFVKDTMRGNERNPRRSLIVVS
jgi:hypothetical protein